MYIMVYIWYNFMGRKNQVLSGVATLYFLNLNHSYHPMSDLGLRHAQKTCLDLPHIHIQNYLTQFFLEQAVPGGGHLRSNQQASEKTIA